MIYETVEAVEGASGPPLIRLKCDNDDYNFTLAKSREDSPHALVDYGPGKRKVPLVQGGGFLQGAHLTYLRQVLGAVEGESKVFLLRELCWDKARASLSVRFTRVQSPPSEHQLYLDPNRNWRVVECRVENASFVAAHKMTYGAPILGLEIMSEDKSSYTWKIAKAEPNSTITARVLSIKLTDKTPNDFRLPAFGIPEPVDVPPAEKPTRWYRWLLAAAGVCAVLSFSFGYVRRRRARAASPPPPGASS